MNMQDDILIVDDDLESLRLLTELLEKEGYEVRPAYKAQTAIETALAKPPSLILLDVRMPEIDGFEVCRRLAQDKMTQHVPIVFVSALQDLEARVQGFQAGGVDFITKPFQELEILARVKTHLALYRAQHNLKQLVDERTIELRKSREFNRAVFMSMTDHIAVLDKNGDILSVNESWLDFARTNDVSSPELVGEGINYLDVCRRVADDSEDFAQRTLRGIQSVLNGKVEQLELEYPCHSPAEQRWFLMRVVPYRGEMGGAVVSHNDITARKLAEEKAKKRREELIHIGRIAILGDLSASIAHELNQPLTGILSNGQACEMLLRQGDVHPTEIEEIIQDIVADAKRSGDTLRNLRKLFRKQKDEFKPLNINRIISETIRILSSEFVIQGLAIREDLTDPIPAVIGNKVQLQQVLINLFINAKQAMEHQAKENRSISIFTSRRNESEVQIQVKDTGPGIDPEKLESIFDSLTTLKPDGLGMGLSISRSIVLAHGGRIWAENKPSGGAIISFTLPAAEKKS